GNYDQLGQYITARIQTDFQPFGLSLVNLFVENISLPPEVEAAMDKRTSMGVIGNLQAYTQYQTAEAIPEAAKASGGMAGAAAGHAAVDRGGAGGGIKVAVRQRAAADPARVILPFV